MIARRESAAAAWWLLGCCFMVAVMVALGGLTRLTHSGLSMAEWRPLHFLPPLSEAEWQDWYAKYRLTPEFLKINSDMTIEGFKGIFWLEFIHRLWGRALGLAFLLPMLWLAFTGRIARRRVPQLGLVFLLGAAQGAMGWCGWRRRACARRYGRSSANCGRGNCPSARGPRRCRASRRPD
ncbi:MAG: COX15/CtaA family protein, partial [Alphaproteobacteria bacterium]|nr:COX15/CtaA family protein [Alphaproteobacteria bacterium]